jgi:hypothetical protein
MRWILVGLAVLAAGGCGWNFTSYNQISEWPEEVNVIVTNSDGAESLAIFPYEPKQEQTSGQDVKTDAEVDVTADVRNQSAGDTGVEKPEPEVTE